MPDMLLPRTARSLHRQKIRAVSLKRDLTSFGQTTRLSLSRMGQAVAWPMVNESENDRHIVKPCCSGQGAARPLPLGDLPLRCHVIDTAIFGHYTRESPRELPKHMLGPAAIGKALQTLSWTGHLSSLSQNIIQQTSATCRPARQARW